MPKNKIEDLRNILFETMEKLMDDEDPMDLDRAETVAKVAQVVVNSAKVEVDFIKQTGAGGSTFIQNQSPQQRQIEKTAPTPPPIEITPETPQEVLCQHCQLPDCDDTSANCLIQIQKRAAAAV